MKLPVSPHGSDTLNTDNAASLNVDIDHPCYEPGRGAWATNLHFSGPDGSRELKIYGATALQSLLLAVKLAMRLYEPDILGETDGET